MNQRRYYFFKFIFILLTFILLRIDVWGQIESEQTKLVNTDNLQYELMMTAYPFPAKWLKIQKFNAALLISNEDEIKVDAEMFLSRTNMAHLCGYHYRILFWTNTDSLFDSRYINESCDIESKTFGYKPEEACKKLSYYIGLLETKPTHYIYSLEIPVSMEPNEIREKLKNTELPLFFIDGEETRFPSIEFLAESRKIIKELVEKIKSISSIIDESDIIYSSSSSQRGRITLTFEKGTDLSKIIMLLEHEGAEIEEQNNPKTYCVQVVDTSANIRDIRKKIKKYKFIKKITEYTVEYIIDGKKYKGKEYKGRK